MSNPDPPFAVTSVHAQRRVRLAQAMRDGIAIVATAPERLRNRDIHYPYRYDSYFYYLTGFPEPEAVLVLIAGDETKSLLFCREHDVEREIWDGFRYGVDGARIQFGFDECHPIDALDSMLPSLLANQPQLFCRLGEDGAWDHRVLGWVRAVRAEVRQGFAAPTAIHDIAAILDEMRLIKDPYELTVLRRAAEIAAAAHRRAMRSARPGGTEYELEAELLHEFRRLGAQAPAYAPIVASGAHACVLHYVRNDAALNGGDLVLIDAGCELDGYASDLTRTFPVDGKFTPLQQDLYQMVLAAQAAAIDAIRPGAPWIGSHDAAVRVLAQGLIDLGLCDGGVDGVIESGDYKRFYMHRTGHWLGLDVHDAGNYKRNGAWRALTPGMVLTVEPGCYVRPAEGVPERFWNIGIRIEDDVVVTPEGCDVLTKEAPKTIADIETLMNE